ncbi:MAG: hypothetical protein AAF340_17970 [Pseudomonadota bacterium]
MGLYDQPRELRSVPDFTQLESPEEPQGSVLGAGFRQENVVTGAVREGLATNFGYEPPFAPRTKSRYSVWQDIQGTDYEEHWDSFAGVTDKNEAQRIKRKIDQERRDRRILANAGGTGIAAQLVAGFIDAPTLVPGAQAIRGATRGYSIGRNALQSSAAAVSEAVAVEAALQSFQQTRTAEESAVAIGSSMLLGLALGSGVGAFMKTPEAPTGLSTTQRGQGLDLGLYELEGRNLSAAAVDGVKLKAGDFTLPTAAANKVADFTPSALSFTDTFRQASSVNAKQLGAELLTDAYSFQGKGRLGTSAESQFDVEYGKAAIAQRRTFDSAFSDLRKADETGLTRQDMSEGIARALRRGDASDNPHFARAAQDLRTKVIEPLKNKAVQAGLLPEDVVPTGAKSYFPRLWDAAKIDARAADFKARLVRQFAADARNARAAGAEGFDLSDVELDGYARLDAESVYDTLTGATRRAPYS